VVDFDGDKVLDVVAGCFQGFVYLVRGLGTGSFAPPERLKDGKGAWVHLGEFWDETAKKWGASTEAGTAVSDLCVNPIAADWDGDGDLDLVLGGYGGQAGVRINEGSREKHCFASANLAVQADGAPLKLKSGLSPAVADWDGDGRWDLVCADSAGSVLWFRNAGDRGTPKLEAGRMLLAAPKAGERDRPQQHLKIDVDDFNADGKLDLIVGAKDAAGARGVWVLLRP
jgi:hypothetical protein